MTITALPCPRCGSINLRLWSLPDCQSIGPGWTVLCRGKGCFYQAGLREWNRRPPFWQRLLPGLFAVTFVEPKARA